MIYRITRKYIRQQQRHEFAFILVLSALFLSAAYQLITAKNLEGILWPVLAILLLPHPIFRACPNIRAGENCYPVIEINETAKTIKASHDAESATADISQIQNLRLQYRSGIISSIILKTHKEETLRLYGYENLEKIAETLEKLTPVENITRVKFFHH
ncbi:MAG TPA: hypothetical protein VIM96_01450 [Pseudomonadales bacterium]